MSKCQTRVEHIAIFAANPKALVDWYCEHLGFRVVTEDSGHSYFIALPDGDMIEVLKAADKDRAPATFEEAGLRHLAFTVENYDEVAERWPPPVSSSTTTVTLSLGIIG